MTVESVVGVLIAVAVPVWLVIEQVVSWKLFEPSPRRSMSGGLTPHNLPVAPARSR
jgi:hypothetical protein